MEVYEVEIAAIQMRRQNSTDEDISNYILFSNKFYDIMSRAEFVLKLVIKLNKIS